MAWIESHQELAAHPKTKRLARQLGASIPAVLGHLHLLWWWALDYADDGDLSGYSAEDLADAMLYDGDPERLVAALVSCGVNGDHGFLVRDDDGNIHIHDWSEYAGRLVDQREKAKARTKKWRTEHGTHTPENVTHNVRATYDATVPNTTQHDMTVPVALPRRKAPANAEQFAALCEVDGLDPSGDIPETNRKILCKRAKECAAVRWTGKAILKIAELWEIEHPDIPASSAVVVKHGARLLAHPPRGPSIPVNGRARGPTPYSSAANDAFRHLINNGEFGDEVGKDA